MSKKYIYESERYFVFYDFSSSHGRLLLRSDKRKGYQMNIDIIFFNTIFIQSMAALQGLKIKIVKKLPLDCIPVANSVVAGDSMVFEIESGREIFVIAAGFVRVYQNHLDYDESSLDFSRPTNEDDEIANSF